MKGQKEQRVTIITAYRPGEGCPNSGCGTVWRQQFDYYKENEREMDSKKIDPRKYMLTDLEKVIEEYQERNS